MSEKVRVSLSWKFAAIILIAGMLPLLFFTTAVTRWLLNDYKTTLLSSYRDGAWYISESIEHELHSLDDISKISYFYNPAGGGEEPRNYMNYDNLHKILLQRTRCAGRGWKRF